MKKLLLSLMICLGIIMISSQTYAQNNPGEKLKPYVGNTYNYSFDGIDEGLDYEFYFSASSTGKGATDGTFTGYIVGSASGLVTSTNKVSVDVAYPEGATTGTEVYLFLKIYDQDDSEGDICENYKAVGITPMSNNFVVTLADITVGGVTTSCPDYTGLQAVVAPSGTYNAGTSELKFTATRDASANGWSLDFNIEQNAGTTYDYSYSISGGATVNSTDISANLESVSLASITTQSVTITLVVQNYQGEKPLFTITPTGATDLVNLSSPLPATLTPLTHTINKMPVIGDFN